MEYARTHTHAHSGYAVIVVSSGAVGVGCQKLGLMHR